jgi:hypothetical protein
MNYTDIECSHYRKIAIRLALVCLCVETSFIIFLLYCEQLLRIGTSYSCLNLPGISRQLAMRSFRLLSLTLRPYKAHLKVCLRESRLILNFW